MTFFLLVALDLPEQLLHDHEHEEQVHHGVQNAEPQADCVVAALHAVRDEHSAVIYDPHAEEQHREDDAQRVVWVVPPGD